jgi:hydroxyacylglutathione hydrolase
MAEIVTLRDQGLGNASYLVDLGDGRGLVVDPFRDPSPYLAAAGRRGLRLAWTVETHLHADFVSGSRELAAMGATVVAPASARLQFPHRGLGDGDQLDLGGLGLRGLATPGHTPEHLAFMLADGARPLALFSGGSLLVGAVARTDLVSPDRTEQLARALWRSLHERVLTLPDDLAVYPTHGAGSFCSAPTDTEPTTTTTIGRQKATNPLLAAPDEDTFVKLLVGGLGSYPRYFLRLRETNRRGPRVYGATPPPLAPLPPAQVRRLVAGGAELVDARPIAAFAAGHVPGALSIPLRPAAPHPPTGTSLPTSPQWNPHRTVLEEAKELAWRNPGPASCPAGGWPGAAAPWPRIRPCRDQPRGETMTVADELRHGPCSSSATAPPPRRSQWRSNGGSSAVTGAPTATPP